jgi:hypothetical protein
MRAIVMNEMECVQTTKWYCMQCRKFLPIKQFKAGPKRWICRRHYNEKWHKVKMERWNKNPQQKRCNIMWQIAYKDSVIVFLLKIEITPAQVLILLQLLSDFIGYQKSHVSSLEAVPLHKRV